MRPLRRDDRGVKKGKSERTHFSRALIFTCSSITLGPCVTPCSPRGNRGKLRVKLVACVYWKVRTQNACIR